MLESRGRGIFFSFQLSRVIRSSKVCWCGRKSGVEKIREYWSSFEKVRLNRKRMLSLENFMIEFQLEEFLLDRIFYHRKDQCCVCEREEESSNHLFLQCNVVNKIWTMLARWLKFSFITPPNLSVHWECWSKEGTNKRTQRGLWIIWHATIWVIWQSKNHVIFQNEVIDAEAIMEDIKVLSQQCKLSTLEIPTCLYYEWTWRGSHLCSLKLTLSPTF